MQYEGKVFGGRQLAYGTQYREDPDTSVVHTTDNPLLGAYNTGAGGHWVCLGRGSPQYPLSLSCTSAALLSR